MKKFNAVIRPYFQRKGIAMRVGGGWGAIYFDNKSPKRENYRIADFPVEIKEILTAVVDGRFHLEDCMDDFTPEEK
jgi:hypothetical protein